MGKFILDRFSSAEELASAATEQWLDQLSKAAKENYYVALSGGRISASFFAAIAASAKRRNLSLTGVHFCWADERCVPPEHEESNYRLAFEKLLRPAKIPADHVHRIRGEEMPTKAAELASAEIRRTVPLDPLGWPVLDMVFLGMGEDGHVASLFPPPKTAPAADIYFPVVASKPPPNRITISYETIVAAKQVWVLISGSGKDVALRKSLSDSGKTPLARVISLRIQTRILTNLK